MIRYHSLAIERESLPARARGHVDGRGRRDHGRAPRELAATATPLEGVQFHPESILTEHGHAMLKNFLECRPDERVVVDLRSDTVTRPTAAMRAAMAAAPRSATTCSATTRPSTRCRSASPRCSARRRRCSSPAGTQSNLVGDHEPLRARRRVHRRPDGAHLSLGRRRRGGARQRPAAAARARSPTARWRSPTIEAAIKPDDSHFARSRLLASRTRIGGKRAADRATCEAAARAREAARPRDAPRRRASVQRRGRAGRRSARQPRARSPRRSTASRSASRKGLGAPVGSALVGSRDFIARRASLAQDGRRRHAPGGHVSPPRRCYALEHHVERLADDHALATRLADGLAGVAGPHGRARRRPTSCSSTWRATRAAGPAGAPEVARRPARRGSTACASSPTSTSTPQASTAPSPRCASTCTPERPRSRHADHQHRRADAHHRAPRDLPRRDARARAPHHERRDVAGDDGRDARSACASRRRRSARSPPRRR